MDVRHRGRDDESSSLASYVPSRRTRVGASSRDKRWSWWWVFVAVALAAALGWWLFVLKWEWYCFAWHSWIDWSLHNAEECQLVQSPNLERGRLLTAAYGFRSVWEGQLLSSARVVVKELKDPQSCGDVKAHFREVAIERRLRHPSIVPYIASCNIAPHFILVSEYLEGGPLLIGITPNTPHRTYLSIMLDLARGLEYLHYGIEDGWTLIHDDLNPEQILLNANRTKGFITDFNLASWIRTGERWGVRRYWWPKGGSWRWFAPEKLRLHYYWEAADIWSFGVLLYQTLARLHGQQDEWTMNVNRDFYEHRILRAEVYGWRPKKLRFSSHPVVFDKVWDLVEECWRYDPHTRPNATDIVHILEDLLHKLQ